VSIRPITSVQSTFELRRLVLEHVRTLGGCPGLADDGFEGESEEKVPNVIQAQAGPSTAER
jgi:hypothetical protein